MVWVSQPQLRVLDEILSFLLIVSICWFWTNSYIAKSLSCIDLIFTDQPSLAVFTDQPSLVVDSGVHPTLH